MFTWVKKSYLWEFVNLGNLFLHILQKFGNLRDLDKCIMVSYDAMRGYFQKKTKFLLESIGFWSRVIIEGFFFFFSPFRHSYCWNQLILWDREFIRVFCNFIFVLIRRGENFFFFFFLLNPSVDRGFGERLDYFPLEVGIEECKKWNEYGFCFIFLIDCCRIY